MPRSSRQKLKLFTLMDYLLKNTDENHAVTVKDIIEYLEKNGISAERKSIYDDIEQLSLYGLDICKEKSERTTWYKVVSREFELQELKILVDAVQVSKFITEKKSDELIKKLETLCSRYEAYELDRQTFTSGRVKSMNESIYNNVDKIHSAIKNNHKVTFKYFDYDVQKKKVFRYDGKTYTVSPFALNWDDENYYLIAYDSERGEMRHYRVDKMDSIKEDESSKREGTDLFKKTDVSSYSRKVFSMFGGDTKKVCLEFADKLASVVIDRFGKDMFLSPSDKEGYFTFETDVVVSPQFFAWMFSFGDDARILHPSEVVEEFKERIAKVANNY